MLLSPSRADCIVFGVDGVLVDGSAAFASAAAQCLSVCRGGSARPAEPLPDLAPYCATAQSYGFFETFGDVVWALLSLAAKSGRDELADALPSLRGWEAELDAALADGGLAHFDPAPVDRGTVSAIFSELYYGSGAVKSSLLKEPAEGTRRLEKGLFKTKWDSLPFPVGIFTARGKNGFQSALDALEWQNFPRSHAVFGASERDVKSLESLCRAMNARWPLFLGSSPAEFQLMSDFGRGDFIAVGNRLKNNVIRFSSAADALRAILGVV